MSKRRHFLRQATVTDQAGGTRVQLVRVINHAFEKCMNQSHDSIGRSRQPATTSSRTSLDFAWAHEALATARIRPRLTTSLTTLVGAWQATLKPMYVQEQRRLVNVKSVHQGRRSLAMDVSADTYSMLLKTYHHFLQMCVTHVLGTDRALPALPEGRQFARRLESAFPTISADCWSGDEMLMCRAVRQTMTDDNGIDHPRLNRWRDHLSIDDGRLHVRSTDVFALYQKLKSNVEQLIQGVVKQPALQ